VDANGALQVCGTEEADEVGLLGLRDGTSQTPFTAAVPTPMPSMAGVRVRAVVCHEDCSFAVSEAGQVFAWGRQDQASGQLRVSWAKGQPAVPAVMEELRLRQVAAAFFHCAALTEDGALFTWETLRGIDTETDEPVPELGYGSFVHDVGVPYRVFALAGERIASVAVGNYFTVAVTAAGAVYSFGRSDGRLGHADDRDTMDDVYLPKRIEALDGLHVVAVAAGDVHTLALTRCGRVYSWGSDDGDGDNLALGLGNDSSEDGDLDDVCYWVPQLITALLGRSVRAIAASHSMACAVTDAGALYTVGRNHCGNLGHGDLRHRNRPTLVQGLHGIRVVGVSFCDSHTLALAADGSVYAFGAGPGLGVSQRGEGEEGNKEGRSPQKIPDLICLVPRK
jgi:alpha-tubulin suppressor-like RCC1 family protein